jgi:hypothetical protein
MSPIIYEKQIEPIIVASTSGPIPDTDREEIERDFFNYVNPSVYTERIQRELNNQSLTGCYNDFRTLEWEILVYQSGVCLLVDNVQQQTYGYREEGDCIHYEDATNYLRQLNLCRCCENHINQRDMGVCRSVDGCECQCSGLFDEILNCQARDRHR